jgi:hypothetical protein
MPWEAGARCPVQAMGSFDGGSGAADGLNDGFINADSSQQI